MHCFPTVTDLESAKPHLDEARKRVEGLRRDYLIRIRDNHWPGTDAQACLSTALGKADELR